MSGILRISSTKMYQVNELLAFVLPMRSLNRFPVIHHMTSSPVRSDHRSIVESEPMPFMVRSNFACAQFAFLRVRVQNERSVKTRLNTLQESPR